MHFRQSLRVNSKGHLEIGGVDSLELVQRFGTPLYVMDEKYVREVCRAYSSTLSSLYGNGAIAYASKAFSTKAIYKIVDSEGLSADVVSGGEIYTALSAGFSPEKLYFHGNNKTVFELEYAISSKIGYIVVDSEEEVGLIDVICKRLNVTQKILLRINPGVEAHTHKAVQTATPDSKFGFSISNGQAVSAVKTALSYGNVELCGFHCHIGSQIFEKSAFVVAVDKMTDFIEECRNSFDFTTKVLDLGGGYGIKYTDEDPDFTPEDYAGYVSAIINALNAALKLKKLEKPYLVLEPGRSIVGEAGLTLYSVGAVKDIPSVRKYVSVDGGMFDNPRYALYGSKYAVKVANRPNDVADEVVTIAGKCCESGDVLAVDVSLPRVSRGDVLAVFSTGAYNYSMSSNYNRNLVPPVVLVCDGKADYIVKPQTYDDLIRNDVVPDRLK